LFSKWKTDLMLPKLSLHVFNDDFSLCQIANIVPEGRQPSGLFARGIVLLQTIALGSGFPSTSLAARGRTFGGFHGARHRLSGAMHYWLAMSGQAVAAAIGAEG